MQHVPQKARHGHLIHFYRELPPERRPQDPTGDGAGWTFELLEHGGEHPDAMPQAIRATDAQGDAPASMCRLRRMGAWSIAAGSSW